MTFEPGDVVMLKSGGQSMTVVSASEEEITCLWINDAGEMFREAIPAVALEAIQGHGDDEKEEDEKEEDEEEEDEEDDGEEDDEHEEDEDEEDEEEEEDDDEDKKGADKKRK